MHSLLGVKFGNQIWLSIPNDYGQKGLGVDISLTTALNALFIATNAITTIMISYKLWYVLVAEFTTYSSSNEVIIQESP